MKSVFTILITLLSCGAHAESCRGRIDCDYNELRGSQYRQIANPVMYYRQFVGTYTSQRGIRNVHFSLPNTLVITPSDGGIYTYTCEQNICSIDHNFSSYDAGDNELTLIAKEQSTTIVLFNKTTNKRYLYTKAQNQVPFISDYRMAKMSDEDNRIHWMRYYSGYDGRYTTSGSLCESRITTTGNTLFQECMGHGTIQFTCDKGFCTSSDGNGFEMILLTDGYLLKNSAGRMFLYKWSHK